MGDKVLLVDDDANLLASYERQLRKKLEIEVAEGGEDALAALEVKGPFAVVISDMKMPGMNGTELLTRVKELAPDTVRMMLTGCAELQIAIDAVNEGNIFRFLSKPCDPEILVNSLKEGIKQYKLIIAERELIDKTLKGSVSVLTEILSIVNPVAFSRVNYIQSYVKKIATLLKLPDIWKFEMAGLLSQIGCVSLPAEVLSKFNTKMKTTEKENKMFVAHPSLGCKLLVKIPRLEDVARMIEGQQRPFSAYPPQPEDVTKADPVFMGSQILHVVLNFDLMVCQGMSFSEASIELGKKRKEYNSKVLRALSSCYASKKGVIKRIIASDATEGMILDEDIHTLKGTLLLNKDTKITDFLLRRLENYAARDGIKEPFRVRIPA